MPSEYILFILERRLIPLVCDTHMGRFDSLLHWPTFGRGSRGLSQGFIPSDVINSGLSWAYSVNWLLLVLPSSSRLNKTAGLSLRPSFSRPQFNSGSHYEIQEFGLRLCIKGQILLKHWSWRLQYNSIRIRLDMNMEPAHAHSTSSHQYPMSVIKAVSWANLNCLLYRQFTDFNQTNSADSAFLFNQSSMMGISLAVCHVHPQTGCSLTVRNVIHFLLIMNAYSSISKDSRKRQPTWPGSVFLL